MKLNRCSSDLEETQRLLAEYSRGLQKDIRTRIYNASDEESEGKKQKKSLSKYLKGVALICTLLLAFGSHYSAHALGTLKADLKSNMNISNQQYGTLQSTVALVNTILPVMAGLFVDQFGTEIGSILATSFITVGSLLTALSTNLNSFPIMLIGRLVYGIGSGTIVIIQGAIITHWFKDSNLSTIMGLKIISSRVASFLAMATVIPIKQYTGFYGNGFWIAAALCILSSILNTFYIVISKKQRQGLDQEELKQLKEKKKFKVNDIFKLPKLFWLFALISFTLAACWNTFLHFNTELLTLRFQIDEAKAGYIASISQLLPLFMPPLTGAFIDKFGFRMVIGLSSALSYVISMYLLGFTFLNPILGMLLFSYSLSTGPVCLLSGISVLISDIGIGTALGLYKSSMNVAASFQDVLVGYLQLNSNTITKGNVHAYDYVMSFMLITGIVGLLFMISLYIIVDQIHFHAKLNASLERIKFLEQMDEYNRSFSGFNKVAVIIYVVLLITSWIVFLVSLFG